MDIRTGLGKADFMGLLGKYKKLHGLRKLPIRRLSREVAEKGRLLGVFAPQQIFPKSRLNAILALIECDNTRAFYTCSKEEIEKLRRQG